MSTFDWLKRAEAVQPGSGATTERLEERVMDALRTVFDPEIPVNIYDLGLVYGLDVDEAEGRVEIRMTLTAPGCPVAQTFPATVEDAVFSVNGVNDVHVELVWDPPWSRERMSDAARLQLGML
ncbi:SUF system Fe-S cluster assembly protein [Paraburkholderia phytofirmans]|jgi:FeS assembly SUF system protein|uniref:SUF system Fe-S cluster assembly protein n=1 Tax=Paraburkholderia sp. BL9I2N2 TaxID=1938809 RepID=UPI001048363B|nr:SUF system Fe-S cluster assembly protein [Paraburkholderia sp. BL9I2N2]TCK88447.1 FeS assembly SUF system protein [Paraburkholderia sp. BL9I2N2]